MADALPLFEALARGGSETLRLPVAGALSLQLRLRSEPRFAAQG